MTTRGKVRICKRCPNEVEGQAQVCDGCKQKALLCEVCHQPHGGQLDTTKLCPKCRAKRRGRPRSERNPPWTPEADAIIRDAYANHHARAAGRILRAAFPLRPKWSINRRAATIGAATSRIREPAWSPEEDALLREVAWMTPERICHKLRARGFKRTITAICIRLKRTRIRDQIGGMTAHGLAEQLGVDGKTVLRWIAHGHLRAERTGTTGDNHDRYYIADASIRTFLLEHPEMVELSKLERVGSKMWFLEMITGGRIAENQAPVPTPAVASSPAAERTVPLAGERVTIAALADICGRSPQVLLHRLDVLGLSVHDAAFGPDDGSAEAPSSTATSSPATEAVVAQVRALMRKHRARAADLARWTKLPLRLVEQLLEGRLPLFTPTLLAVVETLDGVVDVTIAPRRRAYDEVA